MESAIQRVVVASATTDGAAPIVSTRRARTGRMARRRAVEGDDASMASASARLVAPTRRPLARRLEGACTIATARVCVRTTSAPARLDGVACGASTSSVMRTAESTEYVFMEDARATQDGRARRASCSSVLAVEGLDVASTECASSRRWKAGWRCVNVIEGGWARIAACRIRCRRPRCTSRRRRRARRRGLRRRRIRGGE